MNRFVVPLIGNEELARGSYLHTYQEPAIARPGRAGQFVNILTSPLSDPLLRRPFSLCTVDRTAGTFTVLIKVIGPGTRLLADMRPGARVDMLAPLGVGFEWVGSRRMLLVAGGVGVAPLLLLAQEVREAFAGGKRGGAPARPEITFCYGARTAGEFVLLDRIGPLVDRLALSTEDGSRGERGFCTELAERFFDDDVAIFTCGPNAMMNDLLIRMRRRGLEGQASLENQMGCGIGACVGCVITTRQGYRRICCQGPVVRTELLDSIGW